VDAAAVLRHAVETSEPLIREAGHTLELELPQEALPLEGDPVRLAQIVANLLNNAARYTDRGGRIALRARREGGEVLVSVRDNGIGFDPAQGTRLFEMFIRGERSTGLGIGLALASRLAQMHEGSLQAHSEGPGRGAEFTLRLPLAQEEATPAHAPGKAAAAAPLGAVRVLVVDDNPDAADTLDMLLRVLGAEVRVARDGLQAIEAFAPFDPDVVLLDIGMPGMDGYEVVRTLRRHHAGHRARMIALTGWGQENDRARGRDAGFDHHLVKPADIAALEALLAGTGRPGAAAAA
jgi:CheY-like chemotaxis protein